MASCCLENVPGAAVLGGRQLLPGGRVSPGALKSAALRETGVRIFRRSQVIPTCSQMSELLF